MREDGRRVGFYKNEGRVARRARLADIFPPLRARGLINNDRGVGISERGIGDGRQE